MWLNASRLLVTTTFLFFLSCSGSAYVNNSEGGMEFTQQSGRLSRVSSPKEDIVPLLAKNAAETFVGGHTTYGGVAHSRPCCTSFRDGRIDCFVRGTRSNVMHIRIQDGEHSEWQDLGFVIADGIECLNRGTGVIDIIVLDAYHHLFHNTFSDEKWSGWVLTEGIFMEVPSCAAQSSTDIACMARGTDNGAYFTGLSGGEWTSFSSVGGQLLYPIGCVTRGNLHIDCFASGTNLRMYTKYWSQAGWGGWADLGGSVKGRPSVTTWDLSTADRRRIDVFSLSAVTNSVMQKTWDGWKWLVWVDLGGYFASNPECVTTGVDRIHCFAVSYEFYLHRNDCQAGWWSGWTSVRVKCIEAPSCVVSTPNVVSCYCRDFNLTLMEMVFDYN